MGEGFLLGFMMSEEPEKKPRRQPPPGFREKMKKFIEARQKWIDEYNGGRDPWLDESEDWDEPITNKDQ